MKVLLYIALYKRTEIARMVFRHIQFLKEILSLTSDIKLDVFCVGSDESDEELCKEFGFDFHMTENKPLGKKMNVGMKSLLSKDFDYLMQCGSDDLISLEYFDIARKEMKDETPYFGMQFFHPYDLKTGKAKFWKYDVNHPVGVGRCFKKSVLEEVGSIWPDEINIGLDTHSDVEMIKKGYRCKLLDLDGKFPYTIGLKSENNLHKFRDLPGKEIKIELPIWSLEDLTE